MARRFKIQNFKLVCNIFYYAVVYGLSLLLILIISLYYFILLHAPHYGFDLIKLQTQQQWNWSYGFVISLVKAPLYMTLIFFAIWRRLMFLKQMVNYEIIKNQFLIFSPPSQRWKGCEKRYLPLLVVSFSRNVSLLLFCWPQDFRKYFVKLKNQQICWQN